MANPSTGLVQAHYVQQRRQEIITGHRPRIEPALLRIDEFLRKNAPSQWPAGTTIPRAELLRVYYEIERNLQAAELTINLTCDAWFKHENTYDTYTQMYERGIQNGTMVLKSDRLNPAVTRAAIDDRMMFPEPAQAPAHRGLHPGRPSIEGLRAQMSTGGLVSDGAGAYNAANPHFNPHTKQIFLGLNYGRRPHGSAPNYGRSYLIAKDSVKPKCLYFAGDTFLHQTDPAHAGTHQAAYENLASILGHEFDFGDVLSMLREHIFRSCYNAEVLGDTDEIDVGFCKSLVLEAHFYGEFRFSEHAKALVISPRDLVKRVKTGDEPEWSTVVENARKFTQKHGLQLYQM